MTFIRSCDEIATLVEEHTRDLVGRSAGGAYVKMGADGTPTKRIDQVAEDVIVDYLLENDLCDRIISEELGKMEARSGDRTVFLDPIDGSFNAVSGIPFYSVSLAYAEGGSIIEGYVKDLAHHETFSPAVSEVVSMASSTLPTPSSRQPVVPVTTPTSARANRRLVRTMGNHSRPPA